MSRVQSRAEQSRAEQSRYPLPLHPMYQSLRITKARQKLCLFPGARGAISIFTTPYGRLASPPCPLSFRARYTGIRSQSKPSASRRRRGDAAYGKMPRSESKKISDCQDLHVSSPRGPMTTRMVHGRPDPIDQQTHFDLGYSRVGPRAKACVVPEALLDAVAAARQ